MDLNVQQIWTMLATVLLFAFATAFVIAVLAESVPVRNILRRFCNLTVPAKALTLVAVLLLAVYGGSKEGSNGNAPEGNRGQNGNGQLRVLPEGLSANTNNFSITAF